MIKMIKKSVNAKVLVTMFIVLFLLGVVIVLLSIGSLKKQSDEAIIAEMDQLLKNVNTQIESEFASHQKIAESISKIYSYKQSNLTRDDYKDIISEIVVLNKNTLGSGIWIEPYKYNSMLKYFGPYVYKDGNKLVYTTDYESPDYNFHGEEWYKHTKNVPKMSTGELGAAWTDPYYDESTGITMITMTVPIYANDEFIGAVSADYDLVTIQNFIANIKIGESGYVMLVDSEGSIIASSEKNNNMHLNINDLPEYKKLISNYDKAELNISDTKISDVAYRIFSTQTSTNSWKIIANVPSSELYKNLFGDIVKVVVASFIGVIIAMILVFLLIQREILKPLGFIKDAMDKIANYNLDVTDEKNKAKRWINNEDEIGTMLRAIESMVMKLHKIVNDIKNHACNTAATSQELTATANSTSQTASEVADAVENIALGATGQAQDTARAAKNVEENSFALQEMIKVLEKLADAVKDIDYKKMKERKPYLIWLFLHKKVKKKLIL